MTASTATETSPNSTGRRRPRPWFVLGPALLALVGSLAWSWRVSYWRDETASVSAATRPLSSLPALLGNVDAVHGLYYLVLHPLATVSVEAWWLRLPSAVGAAVAAALLVVLGRQLAGWRAGVIAGVVWALLSVSTRYGMDARTVSIAVALSLAATVVLVEAAGRDRRRWWLLYVVVTALAAWWFLFSLLAVLGHLVVVLVERRGRRRLPVHFLAAVLAVALLSAPIAVLANREGGQLGWMPPVTLGKSKGLVWSLWFDSKVLALVMWLLVAGGVVAGVRAARTGGLRVVTASLGLAGLPAAVLLGVSLVHPVFADRYVAVGAAYLALLAGYGLAALRGRTGLIAGVLAVLVVAAAAAPVWRADRRPDAWGDDLAAIAPIVGANRRPGDRIMFLPRFQGTAVAAYPNDLGGLPDLYQGASPAASGTLVGTTVSDPVVADRLAGTDRVWVWRDGNQRSLGTPAGQPLELLAENGFVRSQTWAAGWTRLDLMVRRGQRAG